MRKHLHWDDVSDKKLLDARVFDVMEVERRTQEGETARFVVLHADDWVNVVPVTRDEQGRECFIMVHQYRQGSRSVTTEFPGGVLDEGEDPETGAARELVEETGYRANSIHFAGKVMPNPAIMDNWVYTYVAEDLEYVGDQTLDEHEIVDFELIPVDTVQEKMGSPGFDHGIMMISLDWYNRWKAKRK
jgi:8-oxo-dGTP pyrophosphatase MutT (NUDIX family)